MQTADSSCNAIDHYRFTYDCCDVPQWTWNSEPFRPRRGHVDMCCLSQPKTDIPKKSLYNRTSMLHLKEQREHPLDPTQWRMEKCRRRRRSIKSSLLLRKENSKCTQNIHFHGEQKRCRPTSGSEENFHTHKRREEYAGKSFSLRKTHLGFFGKFQRNPFPCRCRSQSSRVGTELLPCFVCTAADNSLNSYHDFHFNFSLFFPSSWTNLFSRYKFFTATPESWHAICCSILSVIWKKFPALNQSSKRL